jgi:hypothetical protein
MNSDPLLVGVDTVFPNQNSSTVPTVWEEDTDQAAQQGIPCAGGPMLRLTKRSSNQPFLPGGAVNPCPETAPFCIVVENIRMNAGVGQRLSASLIGTGLVGGQFIGGIPGARASEWSGWERPVTVFAVSRVGRRPRVMGLPVPRSRRAPVTRASSARRISAASACKGG